MRAPDTSSDQPGGTRFESWAGTEHIGKVGNHVLGFTKSLDCVGESRLGRRGGSASGTLRRRKRGAHKSTGSHEVCPVYVRGGWGNGCTKGSGLVVVRCQEGNTRERRTHEGANFQGREMELMDLPDCVLSHVFSFLGGRSIAEASYVCNRWATIVRDDRSMWEKLCANDFGLKKGRKNREKWRDLYIKEWCWRHRPLESSLLDPKDIVSSWVRCVHANSDNLATGSSDGSVKIWNAPKKTKLRCLKGHTGSVVSLHFDGRTVVSGSQDNTIRIWDVPTGSCSKVLPVDDVDCVKFDKSRIVTGSMNNPIKIWDFPSGECKASLPVKSAGTFCLDFLGKCLVSGSSLDVVHTWDMERCERVSFFEGHCDWVLDVQFDENKVMSASRDRTAKVWDLRSSSCCMNLHGHKGGVWCVRFDGCKVVSGSDDGYVLIWDLRNGKVLRTIRAHSAGVNSLQFDSNKIVTAGRDNLVKVWTPI